MVAPAMINLRASKSLLIWIILIGLICFILVINFKDKSDETGLLQSVIYTAKMHDKFLFKKRVGSIGAIEIAMSGKLHRFERNETNDWFYHKPHTETELDIIHKVDRKKSQEIAYVLKGFGRTQKERNFELIANSDEFGVVSPSIFILIYEKPQDQSPSMKLAIGDIAPDSVSRYIRVNQSQKVVTIPDYQISNLLELIEQNKDPP